MLDHLHLTNEQRDLLYSLPYVSRSMGFVLDQCFFQYCDRYFRNESNFPTADRRLMDKSVYDKIFWFNGFGDKQDWDLVLSWVNVTWPVWCQYCGKNGREPGEKPVRLDMTITPIDEMVF